jgi:ATP-dependent phosphoenolpyruvate carboxykinase
MTVSIIEIKLQMIFIQVAGTEDGIKEPQATFSASFGTAFIMLHPTRYAALLAEKMSKHGTTGWLVNTGWSEGRYMTEITTLFSYCFNL